MPIPISLLRSLFLFSLFCTASAQGLTGAQINIVKQQLQEGATHRSAYIVLFLRQRIGQFAPTHPWALALIRALEITMAADSIAYPPCGAMGR